MNKQEKIRKAANREYFSVPNDENSYWAGFIATDGNISDINLTAHVGT